jgi:hypothetical protein
LLFSNIIFSTKCAPFLAKIGEDFKMMIRRAKGLELMKKNNYNLFEHIWFKSVFDLENYRF